MVIDLHTHSTWSDGKLTPAELVARAAEKGVAMLALTDHDGTGGLAEAQRCAVTAGISFVAGVEISVTWQAEPIHVLGLRIDAQHPALAEGLSALRARRRERAARIAAKLDAAGIRGSLEGASSLAAKGDLVGRAHFARFLVARGHAGDIRSAFKRYLAAGSPAYVPPEGAGLDEAVGWIRASGGMAVIAHPGRYGLDERRLEALLAAFREAGGAGLEVGTPSHSPEEIRRHARHASRFGLLASCGSDFHAPGESRGELGGVPQLPSECRPIWMAW